MENYNTNYKKLIEIIKKGEVGVLATDTLYGLVGSAFSEEAVGRIYKLKERDAKKPLIILISSINDLKKFEIKLNRKTEAILQKVWPGKVSVIFPCRSKKFSYLHRGTKSLAFRFPKKESLIEFLKKTGPLVAPSANREGEQPAATIKKAKRYFGEKVAFYVDGGALKGKPSTLIAIKKGTAGIIREGADLRLAKLTLKRIS